MCYPQGLLCRRLVDIQYKTRPYDLRSVGIVAFDHSPLQLATRGRDDQFWYVFSIQEKETRKLEYEK